MKTLLAVWCVSLSALQPSDLRADQATDPTGERSDGVSRQGGYVDVDLKTRVRLFYWFGPINDSGVNLELREDGKSRWKSVIAPLGVEHSVYRHRVTVEVREGKVVVTSIGAETIHAVLDLATGKQVSRKVD